MIPYFNIIMTWHFLLVNIMCIYDYYIYLSTYSHVTLERGQMLRVLIKYYAI